MTHRRYAMGLVVLALGCAQEPGRLDGVELISTHAVEFGWDSAFNDPDDGLVSLVPLDVLALDGLTGEPLADVWVVWRSDQAMFADPAAVLVGDMDCDVCVWDAYGDAFVEVEDGSVQVPFATRTDLDGIARVYAVVDAVKRDHQGFLPLEVEVELADPAESEADPWPSSVSAGRVQVLSLLPR